VYCWSTNFSKKSKAQSIQFYKCHYHLLTEMGKYNTAFYQFKYTRNSKKVSLEKLWGGKSGPITSKNFVSSIMWQWFSPTINFLKISTYWFSIRVKQQSWLSVVKLCKGIERKCLLSLFDHYFLLDYCLFRLSNYLVVLDYINSVFRLRIHNVYTSVQNLLLPETVADFWNKKWYFCLSFRITILGKHI